MSTIVRIIAWTWVPREGQDLPDTAAGPGTAYGAGLVQRITVNESGGSGMGYNDKSISANRLVVTASGAPGRLLAVRAVPVIRQA